MDEWGGNDKRKTAGDIRERENGLLRRREDSGSIRGAAGKAPAGSKPPPPKAPAAYRQDLKVGNATETGKGMDSKGRGSEGSDSKGNDHKGKDTEGKDLSGKDAKGKEGKGNDYRGGKTLPKVEEDTQASVSIYSSQTTIGRSWGPSKCRNDYSYTQWTSRNEWAYMDGNWRGGGARNPTISEISLIGGETQKLGFGDSQSIPTYRY